MTPMILKATYSIETQEVESLFRKFLKKLPARNIKESSFEVDLREAELKIGEALHILNAMIDRQTDSIVVEYEMLGRPTVSRLGKRRQET